MVVTAGVVVVPDLWVISPGAATEWTSISPNFSLNCSMVGLGLMAGSFHSVGSSHSAAHQAFHWFLCTTLTWRWEWSSSASADFLTLTSHQVFSPWNGTSLRCSLTTVLLIQLLGLHFWACPNNLGTRCNLGDRQCFSSQTFSQPLLFLWVSLY